MEEDSNPYSKSSNVQLTKRQELNNHIVLMRKIVRQSRVLLIRKLVREVKKLNQWKDEKGQQKSQRKAARLLEEINVLKHLKEDIVSTYALQDKKSLQESLTAPDATRETRALAKLGHHQLIQIQVKKYRDSNPHWELQIPVLLEKSKEKQKKAQKKKEKEKQVTLNTKDKDEKPQKSQGLDLSKVEESEVETPLKSDLEILPADKPDKRALKKQKNKEKALKKSGKLDKIEGTIKVQHLKTLTDLETPVQPAGKVIPRIQQSSTADEEVTSKRPRSSFFVGGTEEEEDKVEVGPPPDRKIIEKTSYVDRDRYHNKRENSYPERKAIFRKGKLISNPPARRYPREDREVRPSSNTPRYFDKQAERVKNNSHLQVSRQVSELSTGEKLHPSWEAKKRLAKVSILSPFQGKKISFQDND